MGRLPFENDSLFQGFGKLAREAAAKSQDASIAKT